MKSTKKKDTKPKKSASDELRKPSKMVPAKDKEKNSWKSSSSDELEDLDDQMLDDNFKGFDEFADHADEDEDDY